MERGTRRGFSTAPAPNSDGRQRICRTSCIPQPFARGVTLLALCTRRMT